MNVQEALSSYFRNIWEGISTTAGGMGVTFTYLFFRKPITIQYPDRIPMPVQEMLPERYRGHLSVDIKNCISCRACEQACPIDCIKIEDVKIEKTSITPRTGKTTAKTKAPYRFDINLARCMYCGLCVEPCPTEAITHTREFEGSNGKCSSLVRHFVTPEESERVKELGRAYEEAQKAKKQAQP